MTELETTRAAAPPDLVTTVASLVQSDDATFEGLVKELSVEDLEVAGAALSGVARIGTVRAGRMAYEIRQQTADGEWGREVYKLATEWQVSERTIHRWMAAAQEHFGFELTPAQRNAAVSAQPTARREEGPSWEEDDDPATAGLGDAHVEGEGGGYEWDPEQMRDVWVPDEESEIIDQRRAFEDLIGEPWTERDTVTPSPKYENTMPGDAPARPVLLEPDETWVAFTKSQIQSEHPAFADEAAERSAKARWARKLETEPLELLEELEMIHPDGVSEETAAILMEAEEHKVIVPDQVTEGGEGKKKRGPAAPKGLPKVAEKLMELTRELHSRIHAGVNEGTVSDEEIASLQEYVQGAAFTMDGLKKLVNGARDRVKKAEKQAASAPAGQEF